jgi:hypothetical protein
MKVGHFHLQKLRLKAYDHYRDVDIIGMWRLRRLIGLRFNERGERESGLILWRAMSNIYDPYNDRQVRTAYSTQSLLS